MSTLNVTTIAGLSGGFSDCNVQGEGTKTTNLSQGLCKAWLNYKGTSTTEVRDDFNISSVADEAAGDYGVNYSNNMKNANYMINGTGEQLASNATIEIVKNYSHAYTTSLTRIVSVQNSTIGGAVYVNFSTHGDLA